MRVLLIRFSLLVLIFTAVGCDNHDRDEISDEEETQSFSSFVREVFDEDENEETVSAVEGKDFQFTSADELENYNDLLNNKG